MTPKEKAQQLFDLMFKEINNKGMYDDLYRAKKCALIAVDEIINAIDFDWMEVQNLESEHRYWDEVIEEIEKL